MFQMLVIRFRVGPNSKPLSRQNLKLYQMEMDRMGAMLKEIMK